MKLSFAATLVVGAFFATGSTTTFAQDGEKTRWLALEQEQGLTLAAIAHAIGQPMGELLPPPALRGQNPFKAKQLYQEKTDTIALMARLFKQDFDGYDWTLRNAPISLGNYNFEAETLSVCMPSAARAYGYNLLQGLEKTMTFDYQGLGRNGCAGFAPPRHWRKKPDVAVFHNWSMVLKVSPSDAEKIYNIYEQADLFVDVHCTDPYLFKTKYAHQQELYCKAYGFEIGSHDADAILHAEYDTTRSGWFYVE